MKTQRRIECWASVLTLTFGTTRTADVASSTRRPQITPKEIPWYSFILVAEWTAMLNARCRNGALESRVRLLVVED